jgi:hypothetical protein
MEHRHLNNATSLSSAAIDDIIDRGGRIDWAFLRDHAEKDSRVKERIRKVCAARSTDPHAQKYLLWGAYVR